MKICKISFWFFLLNILVMPAVSATEHTIGSVAEHLIAGTDVVTKLVLLMAVVAGLSMIVIAASLYQAHRHNPKLVPLGKPLLYVVLGGLLIMLPFLGRIFGPTGSTLEIHKHEIKSKGVTVHDIDSPLDLGNSVEH